MHIKIQEEGLTPEVCRNEVFRKPWFFGLGMFFLQEDDVVVAVHVDGSKFIFK